MRNPFFHRCHCGLFCTDFYGAFPIHLVWKRAFFGKELLLGACRFALSKQFCMDEDVCFKKHQGEKIMKKQTRRILSLVLALAMLAVSVFAFASCGEEKNYVYVTISDENGNIALAYEKVELEEEMTIDAALRAAHAEFYDGGEAGFASADSQYGLSMTKLWGSEAGSYGYYVNNASPSSLADAVENGDHIYAFVYTDLIAWSDAYSFFNVDTVEAAAGEKITLTLSCLGYDESWNVVTNPVVGAVITVDGEDTSFVTDENGSVEITLDKKGEYVISANSDTLNLVSPVAIATVK